MKKVFKKVGIVVIVIVALFIAYQVYIVISDKVDDNNIKKEQEKLQEERINAKTLMEYVKTHDYSITCDENKQNCDKYYMEFTTQDFKCDALDDIKIFNYNYFITKDNEIYDISFNELYSNNQNCKKKDIKFETKNIIIENTGVGYFADIVSKDNKVYTIGSYGNIEEETRPEQKQWIIDATKKEVKAIIYPLMYFNYDMISGKTTSTILVLKNDNKIYKQYFETGYVGNDSIVRLIKEEMIMSLEEYGNIYNISLDDYRTQENVNYNIKSDNIKTIISDKGYYYLEEVKTDECTKYKDIECKLELKESEIYKKFSKDIKYIGQQYTILSDNSVIETQYLTYPLDKDLK